MSTAQETEAKIAATQDHLTKRIDALNQRVSEMITRMNREAISAKMIAEYKEGGKIECYDWAYVTTWKVGRRCDVTETLLLPGTKAYRGTVNEEATKDNYTTSAWSVELWLSREEFTIRKLKGQI